MGTQTAKVGFGKIIFAMIYVLLFPGLLLLLSGDWLWIEALIWSVGFLTMCYSVIIYLYIKNPELLAERYRKPGTGDQAPWDKYVVYGLVLGFIIWIVVMPLDAKRFCWSPSNPLWLKMLGGILLAFSFLLFFRSYANNSFLSPLVRVQSERKQQVVSTGVYGFVRHPMYLGAVLLFVGTPLLLGSLVGIGVGLTLVILLAGRIIGEERMLVNELPGYDDYRKKVRYRLLPYFW